MTNSKVHITGDLHGEIERLTGYQKTRPRDIVVIAGDFGVIWRDSTEQNLDLLEKDAEEKNIIYLFIDGNHENFSRLTSILKQPSSEQKQVQSVREYTISNEETSTLS